MKTTHPFRPEVDNLFRGLAVQKIITIHCAANGPSQAVHLDDPMEFPGVNTFKSPENFKAALRNHMLKFRRQLKLILTETAAGNRNQVVSLALEKTRHMMKITSPLTETRQAGEFTFVNRQMRYFNAPRFSHGGGTSLSKEDREELLRLTAGYAQAWHMVMEELYAELLSIQTMISYELLIAPRENEQSAGGKIPVNSSTRMMGAFLRMFYDIRVIGMKNKSEICRMVARNFETPRQKNISAEKLRQHFENPDPETVRLVCKIIIKRMQLYMQSNYFDGISN